MAIFIASLMICIVFLCFLSQIPSRAKLPPGPPGWPFLGNLLEAPTEATWITFQRWIKQYGNLVTANFAGTYVIVIGDHETAKELLDERGNVYSSRPRMVGRAAPFKLQSGEV